MPNGSVYDAIIIGSGFGGSMVAHSLVNAGQKVLMLERGEWVQRGPHNWGDQGSISLTRHYSMETPYRVLNGGYDDVIGAYSCIGGPSVFYGGVALRFREEDFKTDPNIAGDSGASWPYSYGDLEPYYAQAEQVLDVAGESGVDPTEPYRTTPYPQELNDLSETSQKIGDAARSLGLSPFRLPLAINYSPKRGQSPCIECMTCDTFACAIGAKNDLAVCVLLDLIQKGLDLRASTIVTRLIAEGNRITAVECYDKRSGQTERHRARRFILSAGALGSPHLLLASDLAHLNPGGQTIGRYLMRHCCAIVFGFFPRCPNKSEQFHKQLGFQDFYFGHPTVPSPSGKLGNIQQLHTPPASLVSDFLPRPLGNILAPAIKHLTGLIIIAEDQPQYENHLRIDPRTRDRFGLPQLNITHRYSRRDCAARRALVRKAKQILHEAGAVFCYVHKIRTFSHAVGTVRLGCDPNISALDPHCQFRGLHNLHVVDGSFMPTSSGVNPSLTIAANALRVGQQLRRQDT